MFLNLQRKKKKNDSMMFSAQNINNISNDNYQTIISPYPPIIDNKTTRLMELISCAIENWAKEYHLENMPKKIIFEQAFDAMRIIENVINNKE